MIGIKIGVDIDGTVCESMPVILQEAKRITGRTYDKDDIKEWNQQLDGTDIGRVIEYLYRNTTFKLLSMKPVEGAVRGIRSLSKHHTIVFVTSRHIVTAPITSLWIHHHFGDYPIWHTGRSDDKARYDLDLLIDDAPSHAMNFSKTGRVILFDQPWNRKVKETSRISRARNWNEVLERLA